MSNSQSIRVFSMSSTSLVESPSAHCDTARSKTNCALAHFCHKTSTFQLGQTNVKHAATSLYDLFYPSQSRFERKTATPMSSIPYQRLPDQKFAHLLSKGDGRRSDVKDKYDRSAQGPIIRHWSNVRRKHL